MTSAAGLAQPIPSAAPAAQTQQAGALASARSAPAAPAPRLDLTTPEGRARAVRELREREEQTRRDAEAQAAKQGWRPEALTGGRPQDLVAIENGRVYQRAAFNRSAAISTAVTPIRQAPPYSLDGAGVPVGIWDQGAVRATHQELAGRVTVWDAAAQDAHSTHVAGTIGATGVVDSAKGMAPAAHLDSYDWVFDTAEMAGRAMALPGEPGRLQLSNHSYGFLSGWYRNLATFQWYWYGTWGARESDGFGIYDTYARQLDALCYAAPYYLSFRAASNDRGESAPSSGQTFSYYDGEWRTKKYDPAIDPPADNWDQGGYDTIPYDANAKNVITVGAVNDAVSGDARSLAAATMTSFSGWGPADDGRVKPDIVANGMSLFSTAIGSDTDYRSMSGTSMATPNATGSAALLEQLYSRLFGPARMLSSTLKGLLIHTADDLGRPGPDYQFGWGLMNTKAAADLLLAHHTRTNVLRVLEGSFASGHATNEYSFVYDNRGSIRATLCWTDPEGPVRNTLDNREPSLVHDLDLRVVAPDGSQVFLPFRLNPANPTAAAATADNGVDNVEQVYIAGPPAPGVYRVLVVADSALVTPSQSYSLLVSGSTARPEIEHLPLSNTTNSAAPYAVAARITCERPLDPEQLRLNWNTTGSPAVYYAEPLTPLGGAEYGAEIPAQASGSTVYYFLSAASSDAVSATAPAGAPSAWHSFRVTEPVTLQVAGAPGAIGAVDPPYGASRFASGITVAAWAELYSPASNGTRYRCSGWTGSGSVPPGGASNRVSFVLREPTALAWQWTPVFRLAQTSTLPSLIATSTWWASSSTGETVRAPAQATADGHAYHFVGWTVDGAWQQLPGGAAANPARGLLMDRARSAVAYYIADDVNNDGDRLPDWWEFFYFGDPSEATDAMDEDGDGFTNLKEYQDGSDPRDDAAFPTPPSIAHTPLVQQQSLPAPWALTARVEDNDAVASVNLEWQRNGGPWQSAALPAAGEPGLYAGSIPAPGVSGDALQYRIAARDRAGLRSVNGPYSIVVAYPILDVTPTQFGLVQLGMTAQALPLRVRNSGHLPLDWSLTVRQAGLNERVDSGTNGWTHSGRFDAWHVSGRRAFTGSTSWYFGYETQGYYPDYANASLVSPPVYLQQGARLSFRHWLSTEELKDATHAWDGAIVEISTNNGASFAQIAPVGGYPYVIFGHSASAFADNTPCFAGTGGWQRAEFDLSAYSGRVARIRWHFGADGYVTREGWYVDDIEVTPMGANDDWLSVSVDGGHELPQESTDLWVSFNPARIPRGHTRWAYLEAEGTDPLRPMLLISIGAYNALRCIEVTWQGPGSVLPSAQVYVMEGETATFAINSARYYHLETLLTNGFSVPIAPVAETNFAWRSIWQDGTLHAVFSRNLTVHGVPEEWLAAYGITNGGFAAAALQDQDQDRMLTWQEYIAGTDPTDRLSRLFLRVKTNGELSWPSVPNRIYRIYGSTNDPGQAELLWDNIPGTPPLNVCPPPLYSAGQAVYRIGVRPAAE